MTQKGFSKERAIAQYTDLSDPPVSLDDLLVIIRRHNLPWLELTLAGSEAVPEHRQTMPGTCAFRPEYLGDVYRTPLLYRLAFLRQLSTVALATHLDATHTRLSHALGTAEMGSRMLERIKANSPIPEVQDLDPLYEKACLFYCFIHDAFHGPMGHSLDIMRDAFGITLEEKVDDAQFKYALDAARHEPEDAIGAQLRLAAGRVAPGQEDELLEAVATLADPVDIRYGARSHLYFLKEVVDSTLDADRLDYLVRDADLLTNNALERHFQNLLGDVSAVEEEGCARLAYAEGHRDIVADALTTRRHLYSRYYENSEKLVLDDMLCHGVYYVLSDKGLTGADGARNIDEEGKRQQTIREFLLLTDADLFPALAEFRADPAAYELLTRVLQRRYFISIATYSITQENVEFLLGEFREWMDAISAEAAAIAEARGPGKSYDRVKEPSDAQRFEHVTNAHFEARADADEILFFAFQKLSGGSFTNRVRLERMAWDHFCTKGDPTGDLRTRYLADERPRLFSGALDDTERSERLDLAIATLNRHPPLHLSMSSSAFTIESRDDFDWYPKEGGPEKPVLFWERTRAGDVVSSRDWKRVEARVEPTRPHFPVLVAVPPELAAVAADELLAAVLATLRSCAWIFGDMNRLMREMG